jgi:hypothetical protein
MQNNNFIKAGKNFKLALVAVLLAFVGVLATGTSYTRSFAAIQTAGGAQASGEQKTAVAAAKRGVAEIDPRSFAKIKDARKRSMAQRSYNALKAIADNTSKPREASLIANFNRTIGVLKAAPPKTATFEACDRGYEFCKENCATDFSCEFCQIVNGDCYLVQWAAYYAKEDALP